MTSDNLLKAMSLSLLAAQSLAFGLLMAQCRTPSADGHIFFGPSAVLLMEIGKLIVALIGVVMEKANQVDKGAVQKGYIALSTESVREDCDRGVHDLGRDVKNTSSPFSDSHAKSEDVRPPAASLSHELERTPPVVEIKIGNTGTFASAELAQQSSTSDDGVLALIKDDLFDISAFRVALPAVLYVVQNNLLIVAAGYMTATEFQVFSQLKLVTTAIFSVLILGKQLNLQHWGSIALLLVGIVGARLSSTATNAVASPATPALARLDVKSILGISAMLLACTISGLAAVLLEKLYKSKKSFWTLNVHLAFFSLIPAFVPIFAEATRRTGFAPFAYFTPLVWALIATNTAGGLIVAMVLKYADNILKGFAVSAAMIGTLLLSSFVLMKTAFSILQLLCVIAVVVSMFLYGQA